MGLRVVGIGGGARGFSKLPSWFCGNLGLRGGEMVAAGSIAVARPALIPRPEAGLCAALLAVLCGDPPDLA